MELRRKRAATPQKPSRLQPTEPLHMTTRAASKALSSNGGSSRRGSLYSNGQISPMTGIDNEGERYPKRRRVSTASKSTPTGAIYNSQSSSSRPSTRSMSGGNLHPIAELSPVPRRKRKRISDVTAENISVAQPVKNRDEFEHALYSPVTKKQPPRKAKRSSYSSQDQDTAEDEDSADSEADDVEDNLEDTVESLGDLQPSVNGHNKETSGSETNGIANGTAGSLDEDDSMNDAEVSVNGDQDLSDQQQTQIAEVDVAEQSGETQTRETAPQESVNSQEEELEAERDGDDAERVYDEEADLDNSRDELNLPKQLGMATVDPTPVVSATVSPAGSNQDSNADQESPSKQMASVLVGGAPTASQDGDKPVKRLPGRRRAPHTNPKVEAALRRQLHLRMAYRAVAKNLKPILAELAKRSLSNIHKDPEAHTTFSEYPVVENSLNEHFEERLAWIQKQKDLNKQRLDDILEQETAMRKRNYEVSTITLSLSVVFSTDWSYSMLPKTSRKT
jgi:hypothetical protein